MAFDFRNLDERTRSYMAEEVRADIEQGNLYLSKYFTEEGAAGYADRLLAAIQTGTEDTLAASLRVPGTFRSHHERRTPSGGTTMAKVPVTAPDTFAQGEFNRYYIRAVCRRAMDEGHDAVTVYRAMPVERPRPESEAKIGNRVSAERLLDDLRQNPGVDTALGLPSGPNSGLSVHL